MDTDQFPNDFTGVALVLRRVLAAGGLTTGGFNFDAKLRRQSVDPIDLFHAHIGGLDTLARGLLVAERMIADGAIDRFVAERYAGWDRPEAKAMLAGERSLADIADDAAAKGLAPKGVSGRQEYLENLVNRYLGEGA